jgi:CspA family cold shock protein
MTVTPTIITLKAKCRIYPYPLDDGEDLFVDYTGIKGIGFRSLTEGQRVRFEIESSSKGFKAKDVELL